MYPGYSKGLFTLRLLYTLDTGGLVYTTIYPGYRRNGLHSNLSWIQEEWFTLHTIFCLDTDFVSTPYSYRIYPRYMRVGIPSIFNSILDTEEGWITL